MVSLSMWVKTVLQASVMSSLLSKVYDLRMRRHVRHVLARATSLSVSSMPLWSSL